MLYKAALKSITCEIIELHAVFEEWFGGKGPATLDRVEQVLAPQFIMVAPAGMLIDRPVLMASLQEARGSRQVGISIEHPVVVWHSDTATLAMYEEVQHHAAYATRRRSTALFSVSADAPNGVEWQHVHETWIDAPPP